MTTPDRKDEPRAWGLDIGRGAWTRVGASLDSKGRLCELDADCIPFDPPPVLPSECAVAVLDIPIGLVPDSSAKSTTTGLSGSRPVDAGARKWCLSSGSVASPPTVAQLQSSLAEHERASRETDASRRRRRLANVSPKGLTQQGMELAPAIESAGKLKRTYPTRVLEGHPEVAFAALANGVIPASKKTLTGMLARAGVLASRVDLDVLGWVLALELQYGVPAADWLDALAMAVVAADWMTGHRQVLLEGHGGTQQFEPGKRPFMVLPRGAPPQGPARLDTQAAISLALAATRGRQAR